MFGIGTINPNVLLELFSIYRDWQEKKTQMISNRQVEEMNSFPSPSKVFSSSIIY